MIGRLLTARDVADIVGMSTETILRWTRRGEFAGVAVRLPGGAIRYREDELDHWLAGRTTVADTGPDNASGRAALVTPPARSQGGTP